MSQIARSALGLWLLPQLLVIATTPIVAGQQPFLPLDERRDAFEQTIATSEPVPLPVLNAKPVAFQAEVCRTCNRASSLCACSGARTPGGCGLRGTNLFWCSPAPELIEDACGTDPCENCDYSSAPLLFASLEVVPLFRDQKDDRAFQTRGLGGPALLETGDFETEFDAGVRLLLGATLTDLYRVEVSYLGDYEWADRVSISNQSRNTQGGTGNMFSPFSNFGVPVGVVGVDYNNFASIEMTSSFSSIELNLRRRLCTRPRLWMYRRQCCTATSFLVGLRYLEVNETFGYLTRSTVPAAGSINQVAIDTGNEMFGVQIGMLSQFTTYWESGWIDFDIKGGIYQNEAKLRSAYERTDGEGLSTGSFADSDTRDRTAFLGEISLNYNHQITTNLSMRVGYNAFWLTGVALASDNFNANFNFITPEPAQVDHSGNSVYHGPSIGFTWAY